MEDLRQIRNLRFSMAILSPGPSHRLRESNPQQRQYDRKGLSSTRSFFSTRDPEGPWEEPNTPQVSCYRASRMSQDNLSGGARQPWFGSLQISTPQPSALPDKNTRKGGCRLASRKRCPLRLPLFCRCIAWFYWHEIRQTGLDACCLGGL